MLFQILYAFLGCLLAVHCRESGKTMKTIPTISGSLVNLGKMDISFHFNSKETPFKAESPASPHHSFFFSKSEPIVEEPCPCSSLRGIKDNFVSHPSEILNKILTSNDLFSFNKEPMTSTLCCGSHEHAQEDIVTFEFGPKDAAPLSPHPNLPRLPFIFESFLPRRPMAPMSPLSPISPMAGKPKAVEIFLFPKKKESSMFMPMKKELKKEEIQIVGEKELRNDFKTLKYRPSNPMQNFQSSVKKDLTAQERNEINKQSEKEDIQATTGSPNAL